MSDTNGGLDKSLPHDTSDFHDFINIVDPHGHNDPWIFNDQDCLEPDDDWGINLGLFENPFTDNGGSKQEPSPGSHGPDNDSFPINAVLQFENTVPDCEVAGLEVLEADWAMFEDFIGNETPTVAYNPPVDLPVIVPPFQMETAHSILRLNLGAPDPLENNPSPDPTAYVLPARVLGFDEVPITWAELRQESRDTLAHAKGAHLPGPEPTGLQEGKNQSSDVGLAPVLETPLEPGPQMIPPDMAVVIKSRCAPCRFSGETCDGAVGSVCSRCKRLERKVDLKVRRQTKDMLDKINDQAGRVPEFLVEPTTELLSLPKIMMFESMESQLLLIALREEVGRVSGLTPEHSLQSLFNGNLLCHLDDKTTLNQYSPTSSTIAIRRLATTVSAAAETAGIVAPALNGVQLDTFIDRRRPPRNVGHLAAIDQETITIAWRCSYWIAVLLSWDTNDIYLDRSNTLGLPGAKNLVLELTYSIAHRIQELIKLLCDRVIRSISRRDDNHSPVAVCCALWIVFAATNKFEKRNFNARSLKNLRHFLTKLHERSRAAMHCINQYKWLTSAHCCSYPRDNQGLFARLIADARIPKSTVSIAFEQHRPQTLLGLPDGFSPFENSQQPHSYSEVLEAEITFLEDTDLLLGRAPNNRNFGAPRPSVRHSNARAELYPASLPPRPPQISTRIQHPVLIGTAGSRSGSSSSSVTQGGRSTGSSSSKKKKKTNTGRSSVRTSVLLTDTATTIADDVQSQRGSLAARERQEEGCLPPSMSSLKRPRSPTTSSPRPDTSEVVKIRRTDVSINGGVETDRQVAPSKRQKVGSNERNCLVM